MIMEVYCMGWNCSGSSCDSYGRGFMTKAEKVEMLQEYKKNLDNEAKGVAERIKELSDD
ncbi:MAG: hypothetical protein ACP5NS_01920 [Candidatus Pacearchaeota archaeon]